MANIVEYHDSVFSGNTWDGIRVGVTIDGVPKNLASTAAQIAFRDGHITGALMFIMTTPEQIEVSDNKYVIKPIRIDFPAGLYVGDMEITDGVSVKTYLRIFLTVNQTTNGL